MPPEQDSDRRHWFPTLYLIGWALAGLCSLGCYAAAVIALAFPLGAIVGVLCLLVLVAAIAALWHAGRLYLEQFR